MDLNSLLRSRWFREETLEQALANLRRITWSNTLKWMSQLMKTVKSLHTRFVNKGYVVCLEGYISVLLLSCSITTGALRSPGLLPPCSIISIPLHINTILIITHISTSISLNRYITIGEFTLKDVHLLPDYCVAIATRSAIAREGFDYGNLNTAALKGQAKAAHIKKTVKVRRAAYERDAWLHPTRWFDGLSSTRIGADDDDMTIASYDTKTSMDSPIPSHDIPGPSTYNYLITKDPLFMGKVLADTDDSAKLGSKRRPGSRGGGSPTPGTRPGSQGSTRPGTSDTTNTNGLDTECGQVYVDYAVSVQKDYKYLGLILLQFLVRRSLTDIEMERIFAKQYLIDDIHNNYDLSSVAKAGPIAQELLYLLEICFQPMNGSQILSESVKKRDVVYTHLRIPIQAAFTECWKKLNVMSKAEISDKRWKKKNRWTKKDEKKRLNRQVIKKKFYEKRAEEGPVTAESRLKLDRYKLWYELLPDSQQIAMKSRKDAREVSEQNRVDRLYWLHLATFHHWDENEFRRWLLEAIVQYLRKGWALKRPTLSNRALRLNDMEKEKVMDAMGGIEMNNRGLIKSLLMHHGHSCNIANAELRNVKYSNYQLDVDMDLTFKILGRELSSLISERSNAMEVNACIEEAQEMSQAKIDKNGLAALLSPVHFQMKKISFQCDFFVKVFVELKDYIEDFGETLGYAYQEHDSSTSREEVKAHNDKQDLWITRIMRMVTFAILEKFEGTQWLRDKGIYIASSKLAAGYRRLKVGRIMNRVWRKALDVHGNILELEEIQKKKDIITQKESEKEQEKLKSLEEVFEKKNAQFSLLTAPRLLSIKPACTEKDPLKGTKPVPIENSLEVAFTLDLSESHFGPMKQNRINQLTCYAAIVLQPPIMSDGNILPMMSQKDFVQKSPYEGEIVLIMHDARDLFPLTNDVIFQQAFQACLDFAQTESGIASSVTDKSDQEGTKGMSMSVPKMVPSTILSVTSTKPNPKNNPQGMSHKRRAEEEAKMLLLKEQQINSGEEDLGEPNTIVIRVGGLEGFRHYRVRVLVSHLLTPKPMAQRNKNTFMIKSFDYPICAITTAQQNVPGYTTAFTKDDTKYLFLQKSKEQDEREKEERREAAEKEIRLEKIRIEEENKERENGTLRLSSPEGGTGRGRADSALSIMSEDLVERNEKTGLAVKDLKKSMFLEKNWCMVGLTHTTRCQPPSFSSLHISMLFSENISGEDSPAKKLFRKTADQKRAILEEPFEKSLTHIYGDEKEEDEDEENEQRRIAVEEEEILLTSVSITSENAENTKSENNTNVNSSQQNALTNSLSLSKLMLVRKSRDLRAIVELKLLPSIYTGGEHTDLFRMHRSFHVQFMPSQQSESVKGKGQVHNSSSNNSNSNNNNNEVRSACSSWKSIAGVQVSDDSSTVYSSDLKVYQDMLEFTSLYEAVKATGCLPGHLLDPVYGSIGHWRVNSFAQRTAVADEASAMQFTQADLLDVLETEQAQAEVQSVNKALSSGHFVVSVQYRARAVNKRGSGKAVKSILLPICSLIPARKKETMEQSLRNDNNANVRDSSSLAKRRLTAFIKLSLENQTDYTALMKNLTEAGQIKVLDEEVSTLKGYLYTVKGLFPIQFCLHFV